MSNLVVILILCLGVWMAACAWCGYKTRFVLFLGVVIAGLAVNQAWMMLGLNANALEPNLLMAQAAAFCYGLTAFGSGWLVGRVARQWRASKVDN